MLDLVAWLEISWLGSVSFASFRSCGPCGSPSSAASLPSLCLGHSHQWLGLASLTTAAPTSSTTSTARYLMYSIEWQLGSVASAVSAGGQGRNRLSSVMTGVVILSAWAGIMVFCDMQTGALDNHLVSSPEVIAEIVSAALTPHGFALSSRCIVQCLDRRNCVLVSTSSVGPPRCCWLLSGVRRSSFSDDSRCFPREMYIRPIVVCSYFYEFVAALCLLYFEKVLDFLCVIVEVISLTLVTLDSASEVILVAFRIIA